jgi:hypothetical protein
MAGNPLGWLYAVEWPLFAVLSAITWWQLIHEDKNNLATRAASFMRLQDEVAQCSLAVADPVLELEKSVKVAGDSISGDEDSSGQWYSAENPTTTTDSPGSVPLSLARAMLMAKWEQEDEELAAYNSYLASLSSSGKSKTWTNPSGEPIEESVR